jgi:hypothetical protein
MDAARSRELEESLWRELRRQTEDRCLTPKARLAWLVEQLENYVERWVGTSAASSQTTSHDDDLLLMVQAASSVVTTELQSLQLSASSEAWQAFLTILANARLSSDLAVRQQLAERVVAMRSTLGS